ncbi:P-loop NTPase fold protein, partial [Pedobacter sp.]|uniref:P-loop NTPase fold protein n=1 Tax=Pedobacter sp. TaxID=1411316 RepID=UPI002CC4D96E
MSKNIIVFTQGRQREIQSLIQPFGNNEFKFHYQDFVNLGSFSKDEDLEAIMATIDGIVYIFSNPQLNPLEQKFIDTAENQKLKINLVMAMPFATVPDELRKHNNIFISHREMHLTPKIVDSIINTLRNQFRTLDGEYPFLDPEILKKIQLNLLKLGFLKGEITETWNSSILNAIIQFQQKLGLHANGELDLYLVERSDDILRKIEDGNIESDDYTNYWILKFESKKLDSRDLNEGDSFIFDKKTEDLIYAELSKKLKNGDQLIGVTDTPSDAIEFIFEIGKAKSVTSTIDVKIVKIFKPRIPLDLYKNQFLSKEFLSETSPELIEVHKSLYNDILKTFLDPKISTKADYIFDANYASDINFSETEDQLSFSNDVESFATIISMKKIMPPMAIALFGHWGTGKSFFMENLQKRIQEISPTNNQIFLKHIVHVKFNSWHYSDINLWASLVNHIFESLNDYAEKTNSTESYVNN